MTRDASFAAGIPPRFRLFHPFTHNSVDGNAEVLYAVDDSPVLVLDSDDGRNLLFRDPTDFVAEPFPEEGTWNPHPLVDLLGSAYPFVLVARGLNRLLARTSNLHVESPDVRQAVCVGAWRVRDGSRRVLVGSLEEGLVHDADMSRRVTLRLPKSWCAAWCAARYASGIAVTDRNPPAAAPWRSDWNRQSARSSRSAPDRDSLVLFRRFRGWGREVVVV